MSTRPPLEQFVALALLVATTGACSDDSGDGGTDPGLEPDTRSADAADATDADAPSMDAVDRDASDTTVDVTPDGADGPWNVSFERPKVVLPRNPDVPVSTTQIERVDLDGSGELQFLVCETSRKQVLWLHDCGPSSCQKKVILDKNVKAPVRTATTDWDGDGDTDVLVPDITSVNAMPTREGQLILLENDGEENFTRRNLLENISTAVDVSPADLDGDGDVDAAASVFNPVDLSLFWLEQKPDGSVQRHDLSTTLVGVLSVDTADLDGDGDVDIVAQISQTGEKIVLFRNKGSGSFEQKLLFDAPNGCWGYNKQRLVDLDRDDDTDVLLINGDIFDSSCQEKTFADQHGVAWLENDGSGNFTHHFLHHYYTAADARTADFDGDRDLDMVVSNSWFPNPQFFPLERFPERLIWLENTGDVEYKRHTFDFGDQLPYANSSLEVADWNGDGVKDIVTGSIYPVNQKDVRAERMAVYTAVRTPEGQ